MILAEHDQQEIILSYEKDYGSLMMAYNKLGKLKNIAALNMIRMKAESLKKEIVQEISPRKNSFNDQNLEFATTIARSIDNFINFNLENNQSIRSLAMVNASILQVIPQNNLRAGCSS